MIRTHEWKLNAAFWFLGLINNFTFVLLITAAEDILKGHAGVILTCTVIPGFLGKLVFSSFAHRLPYLGRIITVSVSCTVCSLVVALASSMVAKLGALVVQSAIGSLGEISFLALTSKYSKSVVGAWSSGTGAAGIAGAGLYILFTKMLHFTSQSTLITWSCLPLMMIVISQCVLLPELKFEPLPSAERDEEDGHIIQKQYFKTLLKVYMLPLATVYFSEYTINQGVLGTLTKFRDGRSHDVSSTYAQLQFVYQVGVFASRSSINLVRIRALWVLAVLQLVNLLVMTMSSLYILLPSLKIAILLVMWEGLLGGLTYVNAFFRLRAEAPPHLKEWAIATVTVADATGISFAALVSIWLEQAILKFRVAS